MKKTISLFLVVISVLSIFSVNIVSYASQESNIEKTQLGNTDTYYSYDATTKTLTISGQGNTPDFSNDDSSQPWFRWRSDGSIEHVVIEEGVTSIGSYFFYSVGATDFTFPSTVESIGIYAMSCANSVENLVLPEGLKTIGDYAFYFSTSLKSVNIPSTVTKISNSVFESCTSLESVVFDDLYSNVSIGKKAFFCCSSLKAVTVPKRAKLSSYSFGFYKATKGCVYQDFVLSVYRDSLAYTYAVNNVVNYNIINEFEIKSGQSIDCTYDTSYYNLDMIFKFTPDVSDYYSFYSTGDVDVKCTYNSVEYDDNSLDDLNFTINDYLKAGQTYYFTVNCVSETSVGEFAVNLTQLHSYVENVTEPTLTDDGFTTYYCTCCGDTYISNYVNRTGVKITGRVVYMTSPDGSYNENQPIENVTVSVDSKNITATNSNGEFEFYVLPSSEKLYLSTDYSVDRSFDITCDDNMEMNLGNICLFNYDYCRDGYINAKDFAVLRGIYGTYSQVDYQLYSMLDCNKDGVIDYDDFTYAKSFLTYGKIDESIYY